LYAIRGIDPIDSNLITFNLENYVPHLPHQITFFIQVIIKGKMIHQTVIDEGASTCIMFVSCWKAIDSPPLNQSPNTLEALTAEAPVLMVFSQVFPSPWKGKLSS